MERHALRGTRSNDTAVSPADQGEGDSVFAVFARASAAVVCALEFQTDCLPPSAAAQLRARMALRRARAAG
jgi:hypothetical protein